MKCFSWWSTKQPKLRPTKQCQIPPPGRLSNCSLIMDAASCMIQKCHSFTVKVKTKGSVQPGFLFVERRTTEQQNNRTKERGRQVGSVAGEQRPKEKHLGKSVDKANVTRTCSVCAACNASMPTFVANLDICGDMSLALMTHLLIVPVEGLYNRFQKSQPATLQNSPNSHLSTCTRYPVSHLSYY